MTIFNSYVKLLDGKLLEGMYNCIVIITYSGEYSLMIIRTYIDNVPFFWMQMGRDSDRVYIYMHLAIVWIT